MGGGKGNGNQVAELPTRSFSIEMTHEMEMSRNVNVSWSTVHAMKSLP